MILLAWAKKGLKKSVTKEQTEKITSDGEWSLPTFIYRHPPLHHNDRPLLGAAFDPRG